MRWKIVIALLLSAVLSPALPGQECYVSHWGTHTPPFDSWATAATNLMDAVNTAPDGAVIWVSNGVYRTGSASDDGLPSRLSLTRQLTVRSINGYSNTVIEGAFNTSETPVGAGAVRGVYMTNGTLEGFTIRRGATLAEGGEALSTGGGLYAGGGTQINIRVTGNYGQTAGGAYLQSCHVINGIFKMNFSDSGPRVKVNSRVRLEHCRINDTGMMFPDAKILGTNGAVIINASQTLDTENGTHFGDVAVADGERMHTFTLTNMGVRPLLVTNWTINGGHAEDFILTPPAENTLPVGSNATFTVTFAPSAAGTRMTTLWMACNDPDDDPYVLWLGGEGIEPEIIVLATNHSVITNGSLTPMLALGTDFGDARSTSDVITNTYIITNAGSASLIISNVTLSGWDAAEFAVVTTPSGSVAPGATTNFSVAFDPDSPGVRTTMVMVAHNAPDTPYEFIIQGQGVEPEMRVLGINQAWITNGAITPNTADGTDFGIYQDDPIRHVFSITNAGDCLLTLTNTPHVIITGDHPADFTVTVQPATSLVETGAVTTFEIEFLPQVAEVRTADVTVYSDDTYNTNATYTFRITGMCAASNQFIAINADIHNVGASAMVWGDYNNDGLLDLAVLGYDGTNRFTGIYENKGNGTFTNINAGLIQLEAGRLAWGDYDNDGLLDLAVMGFDGINAVTAIYRNQGDGTFANINAGLAGAYNGGLAWGDYDNDGDLDLIISGYTRSNIVTLVYRNDSENGFTPMDFGLLPLRNGRAAWVDHDNSGQLDILITGDTGANKTTRLYKNHDGTFSNQTLSGMAGAAYGGLACGDFNADGKLDLALTGYGPTGIVSHIYRNNAGTAPYALTNAGIESIWLGDCQWADFNNSGWLDLIVAGAGTNNTRHVKLYENTNGYFKLFTTSITGMRGASLAWGDYDNDGDLDIAISGQTTNGYRSFIYRNLAPVSNTPPTAPAGLNATIEKGNEIVFRWDSATDAQTPSNSLTYNLYVGTVANPAQIMSPHADLDNGQRRIADIGNVQMNREWRLKNMPAGDIIWGVQTVDSGYMGSQFTHGDMITIDELPDLVIADIQIMNVPFQASVTVSNRGAVATDGMVQLAAWINHAAEAACGMPSDITNTIGILSAGETETIVFSNLTTITNVVTNVFRAYVNNVCEPDVYELRYDNNQLAHIYTNLVYEPFWFNAVAMTNDVYLRWIDPIQIGMQSSEVLIRWSESTYPATIDDGTLLYQGSDQLYHHTGRTPGQPYYYTIWVSHDGINWIMPPE